MKEINKRVADLTLCRLAYMNRQELWDIWEVSSEEEFQQKLQKLQRDIVMQTVENEPHPEDQSNMDCAEKCCVIL